MTSLKSVIFEKFSFAKHVHFSQEMLDDYPMPELSAYMNHTMNALVVSLKYEVLGERLKEIEVKHPKDWWEAVKERFGPKWFLKRYPVKYTRYKLEARALYPNVSLPEKQPKIQLFRQEGN